MIRAGELEVGPRFGDMDLTDRQGASVVGDDIFANLKIKPINPYFDRPSGTEAKKAYYEERYGTRHPTKPHRSLHSRLFESEACWNNKKNVHRAAHQALVDLNTKSSIFRDTYARAQEDGRVKLKVSTKPYGDAHWSPRRREIHVKKWSNERDLRQKIAFEMCNAVNSQVYDVAMRWNEYANGHDFAEALERAEYQTCLQCDAIAREYNETLDKKQRPIPQFEWKDEAACLQRQRAAGHTEHYAEAYDQLKSVSRKKRSCLG